jgi:hypothetical protein
MFHYLNAVRLRFTGATLLVLSFFLIQGCKKEDPVPITPDTNSGSLSDPSIQPRVIFSSPAPNSTGPYRLYDPGDGFNFPHIVVRFNKLINLAALSDTSFVVEGFDNPVFFRFFDGDFISSGKSLGGDAPAAAAQTESKGSSTSSKNKGANKSLSSKGGKVFSDSAINAIRSRAASVSTEQVKSEVMKGGTTRNNTAGLAAYSDILTLSMFLKLSNFSTRRASYEIGRTYTIRLKGSIEDINGNRLGSDYVITYQPEPQLRVAGVFPKGNAVLPSDFNTPFIAFNTAINIPAAASLISILPNVVGTWTGSSPESMFLSSGSGQVLRFDTTYTVRVAQGVANVAGTATLSQPLSYSFRTAPFAVTRFFPNPGAQNVPLNSSSDPFISFTGRLDENSPAACSVSPFLAGQFFVNNSFSSGSGSISFRPSQSFQPNTTYTFTVRGTQRAFDGTLLRRDTSFSFRTESFRITNISPTPGSINTPSQFSRINISTNLPLSQTSAQNAFSITPNLVGSISTSNGNGFDFIPTIGFRENTTYTVRILGSLASTGGVTIGRDTSFQFTVQPFRITDISPRNGEQNVPLNRSVNVNFNNSLPSEAINSATVQFSPNVSGSFSNYFGGFQFTPFNGWAANTTYIMTIRGSIFSVNGATLGRDTTVSFTTAPFLATNFSPSPGSVNVPLFSQVSASFNAPVGSNFAAFCSITPAIPGSFSNSFSSSTISFSPSSSNGFGAGITYTIRFRAGLPAASGGVLAQDTSFRFTTIPLQITDISPFPGSTNITPPSFIRIRYNSALNPSTVNSSSIVISPSITGTFSVPSFPASEAIFTPTAGFRSGTTYSVTVRNTVASIGGGTTARDTTFSFSTEAFRISTISPTNGSSGVSGLASYFATFNRNIDISTAQSSVTISPATTGTFSQNTQNSFTFTPTNGWISNQAYTVTLRSTFASSDGSTLGRDSVISFSTAPFQILSNLPSNGQINVSRNATVTITSNARIDLASFNATNVTLSPAVSGTYSQNSFGGGFVFTPSAPLAANTQYTVTISTGLRTLAGSTLSAPFIFRFTTGP